MPFDLVDRKVVLAVKDWEQYKPFGFTGPVCWCKVVERDDRGVWIENADWALQAKSSGPEGKLIHFLVPWTNIVSLGYFPKDTAYAPRGEIMEVEKNA